MRFMYQMIGNTTVYASPPVGNERGALIKIVRLCRMSEISKDC